MTKDIQRAILRACAKFIGTKLEPLEKRLVEIETKSMEGEVTAILSKLLASGEIKALFEAQAIHAVTKHFQANPVRNGEDGKDADPIEVADVVAELLVAPEIKTLVDLHVAEAVTNHFQENPIQNGKDAEPVSDDQISKHVASYLAENPPEPGKDGADGVGLAGAVINRSGELVVTKTNGESIALGVVIGKDGDPGSNGKDGADFTHVEIDYDGERGLIIRGQGGEIVKRLPIPIDRGYWREGMKSEKGDVVTQEGSAWIALKDTSAKPCRENADDWRMMARKGRDGGPGPAGKDYKPPEPVKLNG